MNHFMLRMILLSSLLCCAFPLNLYGADKPDTPSVETIKVDADQPDSWPKPLNQWKSVSRKEVEKLLSDLNSPLPLKQKVWIQEIEYSASVINGKVKQGEFRAKISNRTVGSEFLILSPTNLSFDQLKWGNKKAVYGITSNGDASLKVDDNQKILTGNWNVTSTNQFNETILDLSLFPSNITSLRLRIPSGDLLESTNGIVSKKNIPNNLTEWHVSLGALSNTEIKISKKQSAQTEDPLIIADINNFYTAQQNRFQFQSQLNLEFSGGKVNQLEFETPFDYQISSITWGNGYPLNWKSSQQKNSTRIIIRLSEGFRGKIRPILIKGSSSLLPGIEHNLYSFIPLNAKLKNNQIHLTIQAPLQLNTLDHKGFRQTDISILRNSDEVYHFDQTLSEGALKVNISQPDFSILTKILTHLSVSFEQTTAVSEIHLIPVSGNTFRTEYDMDSKWKITSIKSGNNSLSALDWTIKKTDSENQRLTIDFREPLTTEIPQSIIIELEDISHSNENSFHFPIVKPIDSSSIEQAVSLRLTSQSTPTQKMNTSLNAINPDNFPEYVLNSQLFSEIDESSESFNETTYYYYSENMRTNELISTTDPLPYTDTEAHITCQIDQDRIIENYSFQVESRNETSSPILIYFNQSGPVLDWTCTGSSPVNVQAELIPKYRLIEYNVPENGELWKISFPSPVEGKFVLKTNRERTLSRETVELSLATILNSKSFRGVITIFEDSSDTHEITSEGASNITVTENDPEIPQSLLKSDKQIKKWSYQSPEDKVTLRKRALTSPGALSRLATLELNSYIHNSNKKEDLHTAVLKFSERTNHSSIEFTLPPQTQLVSVLINNEIIQGSRIGESTWKISDINLNTGLEIQLHYKTDAKELDIVTNHQIPIPSFADITLDQFIWNIVLPDNRNIYTLSKGLFLESSPRSLKWSERLFGPLGRSRSDHFFNPLDFSTWKLLFISEFSSSDKNQKPLLQHERTHQWVIHSATGITLPEFVIVQTWNHELISKLAWLGMGIIFILGLHIRSREYPYRRMAGYLWYTIISAVSIVSVPWIAYLTGGMLCGSILAILIPRKYLKHRNIEPESDDIPMGSTVSYHTITGTLLLLTSLLLPSTIMGQIQLTENNQKRLSNKTSDNQKVKPIQILTPSTPQSDKKSPIVYIKESDLNRLRKTDQFQTPEYMIKSAHYQCKLENHILNSVEVSYELEVATGNDLIAIEIPLSHVSLGGEHPCQVNGKDHSISLSEDRNKFIILLSSSEITQLKDNTENRKKQTKEYESVSIKLTMHPLPDSVNNINDYWMSIPALTSSTIDIDYGNKQDPHYIVTDVNNNKISATSDNQESANISGMRKIRLVNVKSTKLSQPLPEIDCSIANNVLIHPSYLEYDYIIKYSKFPATYKTLTWSIPKLMHVNKIVGNPDFDYSVLHRPKETLVVIRLKSSTNNDLEFKMDCSYPFVLNNGVLNIPAKQLHEFTDSSIKIRTKSHYMGISNSPGTNSEIIPSAKLPISQVIKSDFPSIQSEYQISPASHTLLSVKSSTEIPVSFSGQPESRSANTNYEYTINPGEINAVYRITIRINEDSSPVFQHQFSIDPRIKIASITVEEDQANRLLRWTKNGNQVTLFLNNKTKGTQNLTLTGTINYQDDEQVKLPDLKLVNTTVEKRDIKVYHNHNLKKQVRIVTTGNPDSKPTFNNNNFNLRSDLPIYESNLELPEELPSVLIRNSVASPLVKSFTKLENYDPEQETIEITSWIIFKSSELPLSRMDFHLEQHSSLSDLTFQCPEAFFKVSQNKNNNTDVFLVPKKANLTELILKVNYKLSFLKNQSTYLPTYNFQDYDIQTHYFKNNQNDIFEISLPDSKRVEPTLFPDLSKHMGELSQEDIIVETGKFDSIVLKKQIKSLVSENQVLLSDCRIWITPNQTLQGSMILIFYSSLNDFSLKWPENLILASLTVNGLQQSLPDSNNDIIRIPIAPLKTHQTILINWTSKQESPEHLVYLQNQQFPQPIDIPVHKNLISLVPSKNMRIIPSTGIGYSNRASHILDWIEEILKTYQLASNSSAFPQEEWTKFIYQIEQLNRDATDPSNNSVFNNLDISSKNKLKSLNQQIEILNNKVKDLDTETLNSKISPPYIPGFEWTTELPSSSIFGRLSISSKTEQIQFWCISRNMINTILAVLFCMVSLFFSKQIFAFRIGDKLVNRSGYCWIIAGLFFWLCLKFSIVGFCLMLIGIYFAAQQELELRKQNRSEATIL